MPVRYMPSWLTADSNGYLKLISCHPPVSGEPVNLKEPALKYILNAQIAPTATANAVHRLAVGMHANQNMVSDLISLVCAYNNT